MKKPTEHTALEELGFDGQQENIAINEKGRVEKCMHVPVRIGWWIFSVWAVRRIVISSTSVGKLLHAILTSASPSIAKLIKRRLKSKAKSKFTRRVRGEVRDLANHMSRTALSRVRRILSDSVGRLDSGSEGERAQRIIQVCVNRALASFKRDVLARGISEVVSGVIQRNGSRIIQAAAHDYMIKQNQPVDEPIEPWMILPEGTCFTARRGHSVVVIVQQKPCRRLISFGKQFFTLALPYVMFLLLFERNRFNSDEFYVFFSKKRFHSINTRPCGANLPYVEADGAVHFCRFKKAQAPQKSLAEAVEYVLSQYWGSVFSVGQIYNGEVPRLYDGTLQSLVDWEEQSRLSEHYALSVRWPHGEKTYAELIDSLLETQSGRRVAEVAELLPQVASLVAQEVQDELKIFLDSIKTKGKYRRLLATELAGLIPTIDQAKTVALIEELSRDAAELTKELQSSLPEMVADSLLEATDEALVEEGDITTLGQSVDFRMILRRGR